MKKLGFVLVITFILASGTVFAQNWGNSWGTQSVTVEGTLQLQNGQIAVSTGNAVYFVPALSQYIGFVEGLKEGSRISILGYASGNILQPAQFTINGKSYDLQAPGYASADSGYYGSCCYVPNGFTQGRGWRRRGW